MTYVRDVSVLYTNDSFAYSKRTGGFVPWSWFVRDETANDALKLELGFFWWMPDSGALARSLVFAPKDQFETQGPFRSPCKKCESSSVADVGDGFECLSCGFMW